ncbi:hypothetical protein RB653_001886, partial [Dictyostelium firmibasis]
TKKNNYIKNLIGEHLGSHKQKTRALDLKNKKKKKIKNIKNFKKTFITIKKK